MITISAKDTLDLLAVKSDVKCDGNCDNLKINAAINKVAAYGGTIRFLPGTYFINDPIQLQSGVNLEGQSPTSTNFFDADVELVGGTILEKQTFTAPDGTITVNSNIFTSADLELLGTSVKGFGIKGTGLGFSLDQGEVNWCKFEDIWIDGVATGIYLLNPNHCTFRNIKSTDSNYCIKIIANDMSKVTGNNKFEDIYLIPRVLDAYDEQNAIDITIQRPDGMEESASSVIVASGQITYYVTEDLGILPGMKVVVTDTAEAVDDAVITVEEVGTDSLGIYRIGTVSCADCTWVGSGIAVTPVPQSCDYNNFDGVYVKFDCGETGYTTPAPGIEIDAGRYGIVLHGIANSQCNNNSLTNIHINGECDYCIKLCYSDNNYLRIAEVSETGNASLRCYNSSNNTIICSNEDFVLSMDATSLNNIHIGKINSLIDDPPAQTLGWISDILQSGKFSYKELNDTTENIPFDDATIYACTSSVPQTVVLPAITEDRLGTVIVIINTSAGYVCTISTNSQGISGSSTLDLNAQLDFAICVAGQNGDSLTWFVIGRCVTPAE